jgi:lambda repressor-like predicted transcriptional regulator
MHAENVKAELRKQFGSVRAFEAQTGLAADSVRDVLRGKTSRRTAVAIADALGKPVSNLFPDQFQRAPDDKSRKRDLHRIKSGAR